MKIVLSPASRSVRLTLTKSGDMLIINGETFDFTDLPNGATLPLSAISSDWINGDVTRDESGELIVPLIVPHGVNAPEATLFPASLENVADGPVALPIYETTEPEEEPV
jgi:hypothetical protein